MKNYTSESDERTRAYNDRVIQRDRAIRGPAEETKAAKEFREEQRRKVEKMEADLAEKRAEVANRKKEKEREAR